MANSAKEDPAAIQADIQMTRLRLDDVADALERKVVAAKEDVRAKFSVKRFVGEHKLAIGLGSAVVLGGGFLMARAIRSSFPVRLYLGLRLVHGLVTRST